MCARGRRWSSSGSGPEVASSAREATDPFGRPVDTLRGVGPRRAGDLHRAGVETVRDLLARFPLRYEDRGSLQPIATLQDGDTASIAGDVVGCGLRSTRRPGHSLYELVLRDASGQVHALWFDQRFLRDVFAPRRRDPLSPAPTRSCRTRCDSMRSAWRSSTSSTGLASSSARRCAGRDSARTCS
jgi:hypothetical protein